jgi:DNA-directed RNA polymerase specialized sigma24 family protein
MTRYRILERRGDGGGEPFGVAYEREGRVVLFAPPWRGERALSAPTLDELDDRHCPSPAFQWRPAEATPDPVRHPIRLLQHAEAVNRLITLYWKPVFYFLRARGVPFHEAEDTTQEFFLRFLEQGVVARADPDRGRFRNFLFGVLKRFLSDQELPRAPRQKEFERPFVSIQGLVGEEERAYEPAAGETPEEVFNRRWAAGVLEKVRQQLRQLYAGEGRQAWYDLFMAYSAPEGQRPSQEALAEEFGQSRDQVRHILDVVRKHWERLLRAEVREQVGSEAEIDDEIRDLQQLLNR